MIFSPRRADRSTRRVQRHAGPFGALPISIRSTLLVALFATRLVAANHDDNYSRAEIWHGSKLVVPAQKLAEATPADAVAKPTVPPQPESAGPRHEMPAPEPFSAAWQDLSRLPPVQLPGPPHNHTDGERVVAESDKFNSDVSSGEHDVPPPMPWAATRESGSPTAAIPRISVSADSGYEISTERSHQETATAEQATTVQPLSFHFTIEETDATHEQSASGGRPTDTQLDRLSNQSQQSPGNATQEPDSLSGSASQGSGVLLSVGTYVLGLLTFPFILGFCAFLYLRRTLASGPLFRVELVNPAGSEQPYHVGLARIGLPQGADSAAPVTADNEPSLPAPRVGTVIDEPIPIAPIGPTYDEAKREEEEQTRELEQAMLQQLLENNLELRQRMAAEAEEQEDCVV